MSAFEEDANAYRQMLSDAGVQSIDRERTDCDGNVWREVTIFPFSRSKMGYTTPLYPCAEDAWADAYRHAEGAGWVR